MAMFERPMPAYRLADTLRGDTMQRIAVREMGSATDWVELVLLNALRPPYIVDDELARVAGVLVAGDPIKIPAATSITTADATPDAVFGRDLKVERGRLRVENGDLAINNGRENFLQALRHRLTVVKRDLAHHPEYGNFAPRLVGRGAGPITSDLAAFYVRSALLEDPRVADVPRCVATVQGDSILVDADVVPISGRVTNLNMVL